MFLTNESNYVSAVGNPVNTFTLIENQNITLDNNGTIKLNEVENDFGILTAFEVDKTDSTPYTLTIYTPMDAANIENGTGVIKREFTFKGNGNPLDFKLNYKHVDSTYDSEASTWNNILRGYGDVKSLMSSGSILASDYSYIGGEYALNDIGEFYQVNIAFGLMMEDLNSSVRIYSYIGTPGLNNYMFDIEFKDSTINTNKKEIYAFKGIKYTTEPYIEEIGDTKKEYIKISFEAPYSHDGNGKVTKNKLSDTCVENIIFTVKDGPGEDANPIDGTGNRIQASNKSKAVDPLHYYEENLALNKKTYVNCIEVNNKDVLKLSGSSIYYMFMEPYKADDGSGNITQIDFFNSTIVKGYTNPDFFIERRNIKETYINIDPYPESGQYVIDMGHIDSYNNIVWDKKGYSKQTVIYNGENTNVIKMPVSIDLSNNITYIFNITFNPMEETILTHPSALSERYIPTDDFKVTVGVPLRTEVNNIVVIDDGDIDNPLPIVAQFDLSFDVPEGIFDLFASSSGTHIDNNMDHNLWFEVELNTQLKGSGKENYKVADIIYLDYDKREDCFYVTTQNTSKNTNESMNETTRSVTLNVNNGVTESMLPKDSRQTILDLNKYKVTRDSKKITAPIVLKPFDNEGNFTTLSSEFFSYYERIFKHDEQDDGSVKVDNLSEVGVYEQINLDYTNLQDGGNSNTYFRSDLRNKIDLRIGKSSNYYLRLKSAFIANYDKSSGEDTIVFSEPSVAVNVVFQTNSDVIPVTDNLEFKSEIGTRVIDYSNELAGTITGVNGTSYYNKMLEPLGQDIEDMKFQVFIAEDLDTLKYVMDNVDYALSNDDVKILTPKDSTKDGFSYDYPVDFINDFNINYLRNHGINNAYTISKGVYAFYTNNLKKPITSSTKKEEMYLTKEGEVFIKGLDSNTTYYIAIRSAFNVGDSYRYSDFSKIFNKSTSTTPVIPQEKDIYPPAPENFKQADEIITGDTKGAVKFRKPYALDENKYKYAYEIIRIADERLSDANKSRDLTMKDLYDKNLSQFVGAIIDKDYSEVGFEPKILSIFDGSTYSLTTSNSLYTLQRPTSNQYTFVDAGLKPNRIYFYYARTVQRLYDSANENVLETLYSEWAEITLTTIPIEGIINLREVPIPSKYKVQEFDGYYEKVIAFDAPRGNNMQAGLGTDEKKLPDGKDFLISMKITDEEEEYYLAPAVKLEAIVENDNSQFATFVYRIQKLKSGTKYNVRVAAVDTSIVEDDGNYPVSTYSDAITVRTEFNQDDYNRETKYKEYEIYYNAVLNKINNDLGFVLEDDERYYTMKFKEDKFQGALAATSETTYLLPSNDDAYMLTYYISNQNIKEMMRLKKGLRIDHNGITINIPYNFINDDYNKFYGDLLKNCDSIKSDVEDFYMKLWVSFTNPQSYVDGNKTNSDQVQIAIKFTELDSYSADLDGQLENDIKDYIDSNRDEFFIRVKRQLNNEIDDARLIEYVADEEEEIREYIKKVANSYYSNYELESYGMTDLYNDINIKFKTNDSSSKIYTKAPTDTKWSSVRTTNSKGYANGYISKLGTTVLTTSADTNIIYGNEQTANSYYAKSKYNLDSILIQNGLLNPKQDKVTQSLFYDTAFAVLQSDIDDVFVLAKQKQALDDSFAFFNDPLTRQEILYGIMQLYDEFNSINVNQVVINNANNAIGINFNNYYRQSILAGYQMGLFTLDEIKNPTGYMTVDEMLSIIYRVIE